MIHSLKAASVTFGPGQISSASPSAVSRLIILANEGDRFHHGLEVFLAFIRIIAFFEIFEIDLRRIAGSLERSVTSPPLLRVWAFKTSQVKWSLMLMLFV